MPVCLSVLSEGAGADTSGEHTGPGGSQRSERSLQQHHAVHGEGRCQEQEFSHRDAHIPRAREARQCLYYAAHPVAIYLAFNPCLGSHICY